MATASQCTEVWMRCLGRCEPVKLGCVLDTSLASWAIAQFLESCVLTVRFNARWEVWKTCAYA